MKGKFFAAALLLGAAPLAMFSMTASAEAPQSDRAAPQYVSGEVLVGFWPSLGDTEIKDFVDSLGYSIKDNALKRDGTSTTVTLLVPKGGERSAVGKLGLHPDKVRFAHMNWIMQPN